MQDDSGRQSGWYAAGGVLAAAGTTLFTLGLTMSPRSQTFQFLGLIAFVAGLACIICAMTGRPTVNPKTATPAESQSTEQVTVDDLSHPGGHRVSKKPVPASITKKAPGSPRSQAITVAASLLVIGVGGFAIFSQGRQQANQGPTVPVITGGAGTTDAYAGPSTQGYVVVRTISANAHVRVICTVYGEPAFVWNEERLVGLHGSRLA